MKRAIAILIFLSLLMGCSTPSSEQDSTPSATSNASSPEQPNATNPVLDIRGSSNE